MLRLNQRLIRKFVNMPCNKKEYEYGRLWFISYLLQKNWSYLVNLKSIMSFLVIEMIIGFLGQNKFVIQL